MMNPADNVVTTVTGIAKGEDVCYMNGNKCVTLKAEENIPYCHKVALKDLSEGNEVIKYGESLGRMVMPVAKGCWVNDQNLKSEQRDYDSELAGDDWKMCLWQRDLPHCSQSDTQCREIDETKKGRMFGEWNDYGRLNVYMGIKII